MAKTNKKLINFLLKSRNKNKQQTKTKTKKFD